MVSRHSDEPASAYLAEALEDLRDAASDFRSQASVDDAQSLMERVVVPLDREPMAGFLGTAVPPSDFDAWWLALNGGRSPGSESRSIPWPADLSERVGLQVDFCRKVARGDKPIVDTARRFFREGTTTSYLIMIAAMAPKLVEPMVRDIEKLTRRRVLPAAFAQAMRVRPRTTDAELDQMLHEACELFASPVPAERQRALERLWDAWERARTLHGDMKQSVKRLLDEATSVPAFREVIEQDAGALTNAGNEFYIRHKGTAQTLLDRTAETDYLFMRLHNLLMLVLGTSVRNAG